MHPEDEAILSIIRELSAQFGYYKHNIQTITWRDRIGIRRFPPDQILLWPGTLQLSKAAMGRLTPEEWRPLLASTLLFYKNHNRGFLKAFLPFLATILLEPLILAASFRFVGDAAQSRLLNYLIVGVVILLILIGFVLFLNLLKKFYLKMDEQAGQLVGKERLVASLTKLSSINPGGTALKRGFFRPSIQERIGHLSA